MCFVNPPLLKHQIVLGGTNSPIHFELINFWLIRLFIVWWKTDNIEILECAKLFMHKTLFEKHVDPLSFTCLKNRKLQLVSISTLYKNCRVLLLNNPLCLSRVKEQTVSIQSQWLGRQGAMRHSPIHLKNGPLECVQNVKKWPIENFKIIQKSWKWPIGKNLFQIPAWISILTLDDNCPVLLMR